MLMHTKEKHYGKSIHTGEEPIIYDLIIVSFIKKTVQKSSTLSNLFVKLTILFIELLATRSLLIQYLDNLCLFYSIKLMLILIKGQHLYFSWLCILGIQLRFWTSLIPVEHCSVIPLTRLCYT